MYRGKRGHGVRFAVLTLGLLMLLSGLYGFYSLILHAGRTVSPTGDYIVSFNRLTHVIQLKHKETGIRTYDGDCYEPAFLWSPNGDYLARNITGKDGVRYADIAVPAQSIVMSCLNAEQLMEPDERARSSQRNRTRESVEISRWLDNEYVLLEFSWEADTPGQTVKGWCVYAFATRSVVNMGVY